ncbi:MAG TPA: aminotransferase class V-fold PLP-dependent enzyme [Anaerolineales bacterium]|nr:aminotransferase class V-fold PLP-dependent enzyme [Anaerolineales bacterium]
MTIIQETPPAGVSMESVFADFNRKYPCYQASYALDQLRTREYARLDRRGHAYLDYTGGGLYAERQVLEHQGLLLNNVFGNPHSINPTSSLATEMVEKSRRYVLEFFNASPEEYAVIFTANASGALKLVGESYPFNPGSQLLLTFDNHNSVNGIREFARARSARLTYLAMNAPDLRMDENLLLSYLESADPRQNNLFAFPAQSNFSGVQHSLEWIAAAQQRGWDVIADCAAFVATNRLDLSRWHPDFVPLSFYKMFGYPTGLGCLLARKTALEKLHRPWFSGGSVFAASVRGDAYYLADNEAGYEDGTVNYLDIPAVEIGLQHLNATGIDLIHERVICLTGWLLETLQSLRHKNNKPLVKIYGPQDTQMRGGTIPLNILNPDGKVIDERIVEQAAMERLISIRTGCFCNPGAGEIAFNLPKAALGGMFAGGERLSYDEYLALLGLPSSGALRVSLGLVTNFTDVYRFVEMACTFLDRFPESSPLKPRTHC